MTQPCRQKAPLRPRFWEDLPLQELTPAEWEALCDGCGKCCLNKLEDADTGELFFTRVACRLFDDETCGCAHYQIRKQMVPECVVLTPANIAEIAHWMPPTCAYRLRFDGQPLPAWHPLVSGQRDSVHRAGMSVRHCTVGEMEVPVEDWEDYPLDEALG